MIDELRRENLSALIEEFGSVSALSEKLSRSDSQISQWVNGSINSGTGKPRGMRSETARWIEECCGKPMGWLDQQHANGIEPSSDIHQASSTGKLPDQTKAGEVMELRLAASRTAQDDDVFFIPRLDVKAKGGLGALAPANEFVIGSMSVTNSWIHQKLPRISSKANLAVIEAYGRSMMPTIMSGDLLLVDMGVTEVKAEGIYILLRMNTLEPEIMVKRIQRKLDGGLIVRSDNRDEVDPETVEAHEIAEKISVVGKVVWIWAGREA